MYAMEFHPTPSPGMWCNTTPIQYPPPKPDKEKDEDDDDSDKESGKPAAPPKPGK